jgi:nitrate reductase gamma subunit
VLFALLWVLQTPAAIVETLTLRHSQHDADSLLLGALGVLWSFALGYALPWIKRAFDKDRKCA